MGRLHAGALTEGHSDFRQIGCFGIRVWDDHIVARQRWASSCSSRLDSRLSRRDQR